MYLPFKSCLLFNAPICDILNFSGQVSVYFLHLIFVLQAYAVPIVLLCGYFGWVWRRLLGTWRLVLLRELLPPFLKTRRTYFKHSPNIKGPPCQEVFQKNSHISRLKELPDQEKKLLDEEIEVKMCLLQQPSMILFSIFPGWCHCEGMRPLPSGFLLSTAAPQLESILSHKILHCQALPISLHLLQACTVLLPFMPSKYNRPLYTRTA